MKKNWRVQFVTLENEQEFMAKVEDVLRSTSLLKCKKAPGQDGIKSKVVKNVGDMIWGELVVIIKDIMEEHKVNI